MAAQNWYLYDKIQDKMGDGAINFGSDTLKCILLSSASNCETTSLENYADLTNELATANGYTSAGETLTTVTWTESSGTTTLDADDITWTASGGSITARYALIYDDTATNKPLICFSLLDTAPADVTATDGNPFTIQLDEFSGIFQHSNNNF